MRQGEKINQQFEATALVLETQVENNKILKRIEKLLQNYIDLETEIISEKIEEKIEDKNLSVWEKVDNFLHKRVF